MNQQGRKVRGEMTAENSLDLESRLQEMALDLIDYRKAKKKVGGRFQRVGTKDMIILCLQLEQLSRAGVPLLETLSDVRESTENPKLQDIIASVYESVKNGKQLSEALQEFPDQFDEVFVGLVRAGEKTGDMSEIYKHLGHHFKWSNELQRKIKKAISYPIFLLIVMTGVISLLMIFVVPKLIDFITSQGFEIPIHTRALIATSEFFVDYWMIVFGVPIITAIGGTVAYKKSKIFAYNVDKIMLEAPIFGDVIRKINLSRFTHFFGVMFRSGVDILDSLATARNVVSNLKIQESVMQARESVSEGASLYEALEETQEFPSMATRMFKVGENSGNMNEALENINFFYEREVDDSVDAMVGMLQPALTMVMGILIFWVISAVFGPLYQSFSDMPF
jgi:type IV pilus assembly protein PilC